MDLETENRIAAILLKEAAELRRQAQREGALSYLRQPTVRSRPNSRFLTATVRGVQQANRAVEVNEMWRIREKQLELDSRLKGTRDSSGSERSYKDVYEPRRSRSTSHNEMETSETAACSKKRFIEDFDPREDDGLRDDEVDEFLQSRTKRGRGSIGSRMDETGPYLPSCPDSKRNVSESSDEEQPKNACVLLGPAKAYSLNFSESSDDESRKDKKGKAKDHSSKRHPFRKHKSKEKPKHKKKRREEKKRKHHK